MPEPQQAALDLRPLGLGELLDRTFTLYRNNFFLFIGIMALPETIIVLATLVFSLATRNTLNGFATAPQNPPVDPRQALATAGAVFGSALIFYLVYALIYVAAVCATTFAVAAVYLGQPSSIRDAYRKIRGRIGTLIGFFALMFVILFAVWTVMVVVLVIAIAATTAILGAVSQILATLAVVLVFLGISALAVWILMRFSLALPVLLLEQRGAVDSLARSGSLTQGHRGRVFLGIIVIFAIALGINTAITVPTAIPFIFITIKGSFMPAWLVIAQSLAGGVAGTLTGPLLSIALALIYYDVRIRKEAFDLELMLAPAPVAAPAAPPVQESGPAPLAP